MQIYARIFTLCLALLASLAHAAPYYASPTGKDTATGTEADPMSLQKALSQRFGDELRLLSGTYRHPDRRVGTMGWPITAKGTAESPLIVRPHDGRVTIDGGLQSGDWSPPEYVTLLGLEVIVSENLTQTRTSAFAGSGAPPDLLRPWGGVDIRSGKAISVVNCVIHDNMQGIGHWSNVGGTLYGNIVYANGWIGSDRKHGHGIYMQHGTPGRKVVKHNLLLGNYSMNLQAYGSEQAYFDRMDFLENSFNASPFIIGGGRPMNNVRVLDNWGSGGSLQVGYGNVSGNDVVIELNRIANDLSSVPGFTQFRRWNDVWRQIGWAKPRTESFDGDRIGVDTTPQFYQRTIQNAYDESLSYVTLLNFLSAGQLITIPLADDQKLFDPLNFYGDPISPQVTVAPGAIAMYVVKKAALPALTVDAGEDFEAKPRRWYSLDGAVETDLPFTVNWEVNSAEAYIESVGVLNSRVRFFSRGAYTLTLTASYSGRKKSDSVKVVVK